MVCKNNVSLPRAILRFKYSSYTFTLIVFIANTLLLVYTIWCMYICLQTGFVALYLLAKHVTMSMFKTMLTP